VSVYAGTDPLTRRPIRLKSTVKTEQQAQIKLGEQDASEGRTPETGADRARRELQATGAKVRKLSDETRAELTPQEEEIAELARDGRTNPEIGTQLFIGVPTMEWHLHKVFAKLDTAPAASSLRP
jgi:DNA-binding NarL/FixJ family response regulator